MGTSVDIVPKFGFNYAYMQKNVGSPLHNPDSIIMEKKIKQTFQSWAQKRTEIKAFFF